MPHYKVTQIVEAENEHAARLAAAVKVSQYATVEREWTETELREYEEECYENGDVPCTDPAGHVWAVSDEDENYCYCEKCGCVEY